MESKKVFEVNIECDAGDEFFESRVEESLSYTLIAETDDLAIVRSGGHLYEFNKEEIHGADAYTLSVEKDYALILADSKEDFEEFVEDLAYNFLSSEADRAQYALERAEDEYNFLNKEFEKLEYGELEGENNEKTNIISRW